jgi:PTS system galactitol-specific IIC component
MKTNSWVIAMAAAMTLGLFVLVVADWFQPAIEETFDTEGISIPHGASAPYAVAAIPIHEVIKRIPGINNIEADPDSIQDRFGLFGEPIFVGLVIGFCIGVGAYSNALTEPSSWYTILGASVAFAAVMHILPMMVGILMEGLTPLSESIRDFMTQRYEGRDFAIGLDSAILIAHESTIASSLIIVPIAIAMSIILPGNDVLWGVDLATFPFMFAMMVPVMDGDIVKMVLSGIVLLIPLHLIASAVAPLLTEAAAASGFDLGSRALITSPVADAGSPATGLLVLPPAEIAIGVSLLIIFGLWVALRKWPQQMYVVAGASEEKADETVALRHSGESAGILPNSIGNVEPAVIPPEEKEKSD